MGQRGRFAPRSQRKAKSAWNRAKWGRIDRVAYEISGLEIFNPKRDARFPVDRGVFDMTTGPNGETTFPIRARFHVDHATLFAVTEEVPGGVVVSDRSRLLAVSARTNP